MKCVQVTGHIASTTRVAILKPSSSNVSILVVYNMLHVLEILLEVVGVENALYTGANSDDTETAVLRVVKNGIGDARELNAWLVESRRRFR